MKKQRIKYLIAFTILLCIEILIAICVHDTFIRPYVGDLLVVVVLYCIVRVIIPDKYRLIPFWIFVFAAFIECLQYMKWVERFGIENNAFLRILMGATFDWKDIVCYGIGCILLGIYEWLIQKGIVRLRVKD
ncbi:ribosomal maturation YjgA family protein [Cellulosilyticum lentocellum]|uniref:DUF2809 domain-containing protein n=1 Tax=Cellulosilyticum lentocellum (strain ATCC 49066 / DSM 5427 / NCIMB 11756 / RHM5) TaxID=642492 RepID=F2JPL5_CELLD|nr:DUF2809 domain-containing protein [Cellulosilyticum lentocellum]ADZ83675.1 Protein of unknown function DUF2809 [Cellulosilyticum lentocellum DSM 5427]